MFEGMVRILSNCFTTLRPTSLKPNQGGGTEESSTKNEVEKTLTNLCYVFLRTFHIKNPLIIAFASKIEGGGIRIVITGASIGKAGIPVFTRVENLFLLKRVVMPVIILKEVRFA